MTLVFQASMNLPVSIRVPAGAVMAIRNRTQQRITAARLAMVQSSLLATLTDVVLSIPVETGEARDGWQKEIDRVQGSPPRTNSADSSRQAATNEVDHVVYLEYGTTRMPPHSTARPALQRIVSQLSALFRFPS